MSCNVHASKNFRCSFVKAPFFSRLLLLLGTDFKSAAENSATRKQRSPLNDDGLARIRCLRYRQ